MRDYRFDVARVVCMTYIIAFLHLYAYVYPQGRYAFYIPACGMLANACLGLFTFISGYLLGRKYQFGNDGNTAVWAFYKKRLLRIIPLFWLASMALWMIGYNDAEATANGLLCVSPFVTPTPRTLWYIPVIMWCYLLTPLISRSRVRWRVLSCLFIFGLLVVARLLFPSIDNRFIFNVFFYFVGVVSAACFDWKFSFRHGTVIKTLVVWGFIVIVAVLLHASLLNSAAAQMVLGAIGVFAILFVCDAISKLFFDSRPQHQNAFQSLGGWVIGIVSYASMACYMFHRLFYWAAEQVWNPADASVKWLFMAGLVFPVIIALSYAIQKLYDHCRL